MSEKQEHEYISGSDLSWLRQRVAELEAAYSLSRKPETVADQIDNLLQTIFKSVLYRQRAEEALVWQAAVNRATAELCRGLISKVPIQQLAELVLKHGLDLTGSRYGFVWRLDPRTGGMIQLAPAGETGERSEIKEALYKTCRRLCGLVQNNKTPLLTNAAGGPANGSDPSEDWSSKFSFLSVPALVSDRVLGNVSLAKPESDYEKRNLEVMQLLAGLFGLAVERMLTESELSACRMRLSADSPGTASGETQP
ncbi:MAG: GAF domain-containing protein [Pseudomonadota bacterium]